MRGSSKVRMKNLDYSGKVIIAWCKTIEGNHDLGNFLLTNGFEELYHCAQAILLKQEAREWLMQNGYPHLLAMVNAAEGNESAQNWLRVHDFEILYYVGLAGDGDQSAFAWLKEHTTEDIFLLAATIKRVKDNIEFNHNDMYSFGKDY